MYFSLYYLFSLLNVGGPSPVFDLLSQHADECYSVGRRDLGTAEEDLFLLERPEQDNILTHVIIIIIIIITVIKYEVIQA